MYGTSADVGVFKYPAPSRDRRTSHPMRSSQRIKTTIRRTCNGRAMFFFSLTFLSSRLYCFRILIYVTHLRHSELGVGHWRIVFFSLIPLPEVSQTFGIRTSYNLIRFALLTGEFRRCESAQHVTQRHGTVPLFLGALTFRSAF